jgi:electron transfer flavoprotein alpha/beta subunit
LVTVPEGVNAIQMPNCAKRLKRIKKPVNKEENARLCSKPRSQNCATRGTMAQFKGVWRKLDGTAED